jgi:hypothetical protein
VKQNKPFRERNKQGNLYHIKFNTDLISEINHFEVGCKYIYYVRFEVFTAVTKKNDVFWDVMPCGFVITDVSEELCASFIRVTRTGEVGTTLAVTSN